MHSARNGNGLRPSVLRTNKRGNTVSLAPFYWFPALISAPPCPALPAPAHTSRVVHCPQPFQDLTRPQCRTLHAGPHRTSREGGDARGIHNPHSVLPQSGASPLEGLHIRAPPPPGRALLEAEGDISEGYDDASSGHLSSGVLRGPDRRAAPPKRGPSVPLRPPAPCTFGRPKAPDSLYVFVSP